MREDDIKINNILKGGRTRRNVIGPLKTGELKSKGYSTTGSLKQRHAALKKAVRSYGRLSTLRKLNAVAVLNKRRAPGRSKTFKADRNWVKKTYF
jgi:hypothetical protein